jgi:hypothetical protein
VKRTRPSESRPDGAKGKVALDEAKAKIARDVTLPYDTHLDWAGEINELKEAEGRRSGPRALPRRWSIAGAPGVSAAMARLLEHANESLHAVVLAR